MPLTRALVDRARRVYESEVPGEWQEGEPGAQTLRGPWFPARLTIHQPREQTGQGAPRGHAFLEGEAELLMGVEYEDGELLYDEATGRFVAFDAADRLEVESEDLGTQVWDLATGVEPIRKLRTVIGYRVGLRNASEPGLDEEDEADVSGGTVDDGGALVEPEADPSLVDDEQDPDAPAEGDGSLTPGPRPVAPNEWEYAG